MSGTHGNHVRYLPSPPFPGSPENFPSLPAEQWRANEGDFTRGRERGLHRERGLTVDLYKLGGLLPAGTVLHNAKKSHMVMLNEK